jgi:manganese/zinc/iron transport system permease protein
MDLGPRAAWLLGVALVIQAGLWLVMRKELALMSFDPVFAGVMGLPTRTLFYVHMGTVALTVVAAFEVVGAILVVALLLIPVTTARLWSRTLGQLFLLTVLIAVLMAAGGLGLALVVDTSIAGAMAVTGGLLFALTAMVRRS